MWIATKQLKKCDNFPSRTLSLTKWQIRVAEEDMYIIKDIQNGVMIKLKPMDEVKPMDKVNLMDKVNIMDK
eukprot:12910761-Prorocentrum_lima.AAC.1